MGAQGERGSPCHPCPKAPRGPLAPGLFILAPLAPAGIFLLPNPSQVPGAPGQLFRFLLIPLCALWALAFWLIRPKLSREEEEEEAAPRHGGCIFSAGFARYLEAKGAFYKRGLGFSCVPPWLLLVWGSGPVPQALGSSPEPLCWRCCRTGSGTSPASDTGSFPATPARTRGFWPPCRTGAPKPLPEGERRAMGGRARSPVSTAAVWMGQGRSWGMFWVFTRQMSHKTGREV